MAILRVNKHQAMSHRQVRDDVTLCEGDLSEGGVMKPTDLIEAWFLVPIPCAIIPFRRDPDYIPRTSLVDQIRQKLSLPEARVALVGLGGVG